MARLKLVLAMMMHETNTFSPVPTPLASFRPLQGEAAIEEFKDTNTQLGGFLHVARAAGAEVVPVMVWGSLPMMTSTLVHAPSRQPMKDVMDMAMAAETSGAVLNASVFGGFPHSDIPHVSLSTVIVCDRRADAGLALRDRLPAMAGARPEEFLYPGAPPAPPGAHARTLSAGPRALVDLR